MTIKRIATCDGCGSTAVAAKTRRKALRNAFSRGFVLHRVTGVLKCPTCNRKEVLGE